MQHSEILKVLTDNSRVRIVYRTAVAGSPANYTERVIDVNSILRRERGGRVYVQGYCHLRGEYRTFVMENIVHAEKATSTLVVRFSRVVAAA